MVVSSIRGKIIVTVLCCFDVYATEDSAMKATCSRVCHPSGNLFPSVDSFYMTQHLFS